MKRGGPLKRYTRLRQKPYTRLRQVSRKRRRLLVEYAGSGTTLEAAQIVGRHAIGIDLDHRNADLARDRVGMFLEITA